MFDAIRSRILDVRGLVSRIAPRVPAAVRPIVADNARTRRGNVPLFKGAPKWSADLPITVTASGGAITVRAVDWAMRRMVAKGSPREWLEAIGAIARAVREGR